MSEAVFTCYTCGIGFTEPQLQRDHYKTDWHRYNLKRKVANLPPVTADNFHDRALTQKAQAEKDKEVVTLKCVACQKRFSCQNAYTNHLESRRHKESEAKLIQSSVSSLNSLPEKGGSDAKVSEKVPTASCAVVVEKRSKKHEPVPEVMDVDELDDDDSDGSWESYDGDSLSPEECLFCSLSSDTLEDNIRHMTTDHSFFIPDAEYLVDVVGLVSYLGAKVGEGKLCLWCSERSKHFHSTQAVQKHMTDKGHCKILHEGDALIEYSDFYDYTSSYPEHSDGTTDDDTETSDSMDMDPICDDGYELVLPSGATIGHRSLMRYYKQNIPERRVPGNRKILPNLLSQYKALGWTGTTGALAVKKAADIKFAQRARRKYDLNMRMKANTLQKYFRDPNGLVR